MATPSYSRLLRCRLQVLLLFASTAVAAQAATWCVARSDANQQSLQRALDYACGSGADCTPILSNGLCFLPNTLQAHASYAFNSYYQRKAMAPGSCDFAGTANVAASDPSYGSCVYPSSLSTAGGASPGTPSVPTGSSLTPTNVPTVPLLTPPTSYSSGGINGVPLPYSGAIPCRREMSSLKYRPAFTISTHLVSFILLLSLLL